MAFFLPYFTYIVSTLFSTPKSWMHRLTKLGTRDRIGLAAERWPGAKTVAQPSWWALHLALRDTLDTHPPPTTSMRGTV